MSTSDFSKITVGVIGLGLMGGSFAKRFKEIGNRVIGINRTKSAEEEALRMGIIDSADPKDLKECRIVVSCTPEKATKAFLEENLSLLARDAILTDIAGVKDGFADIAESLILPTQDFISGHPMCGREGAGIGRYFQGRELHRDPEEIKQEGKCRTHRRDDQGAGLRACTGRDGP